MPKLIAPHWASFRGRNIAPGEAIDASTSEALALRAHGFYDIEMPENTIAAQPAQTDADIAQLPRKELMKIMRGRGAGNLLAMPIEELRRLAAAALASDAAAIEETDDGGE